MPAVVEPLSREALWGLISKDYWGTLSEAEMKSLSTCLNATTEIWMGTIDEDFVCVFGIAPPTLCSNVAYLWCWATEGLKGHEFIFVRRSRIIVKEMLKQYSGLTGVCEQSAAQSQRWLRLLGARFGFPQNGFVPFMIGEG
jgi:hypothetical protein